MISMKKSRRNGFTLAELLIVVAIIGVLVAIAIPVFSSQLEKSREAVDFSSIRSAYSELMTAVMADDESAVFNGKPIRQSDGVYKVTVSPLKQQKDGFDTNISEMSIGGVSSSEWVGSPKAAGTATVEYIPNLEKLTISWGNTYGYKYSSMASSDFADKTVPLTPETADQRMAADIDAVSSIARKNVSAQINGVLTEQRKAQKKALARRAKKEKLDVVRKKIGPVWRWISLGEQQSCKPGNELVMDYTWSKHGAVTPIAGFGFLPSAPLSPCKAGLLEEYTYKKTSVYRAKN